MTKLAKLRPRIATADLRTARPGTGKRQVGQGFYGTAKWRRLRDVVVAEANGRCEWDGCGRTTERMFVDHIVEISDGGAPLDRSNLWCLCSPHHGFKTMDERKLRDGG
jgi:5-methylcytosine-specific restriction enzyme A